MSMDAMSLVFWADPEKLSSTEKLVLVAMADFGNDEGYGIWPSVKTLATKTSLTDRSIQITLAKLKESGFLTFVAEPVFVKGKYTRGNEYTLNMDLLFSICKNEKTKTRIEKTHPGIGGNAPESDSPPPVNDVRLEGEPDSPKSLINHQLNHESEDRKNSFSDPQSIWDFISGQIADGCSRGFYTSWIGPAVPVSLANGLLKIGVANQHAQELLQSRIGPICNRMIRGLVDSPGARVEFIIREPAIMKAGAR